MTTVKSHGTNEAPKRENNSTQNPRTMIAYDTKRSPWRRTILYKVNSEKEQRLVLLYFKQQINRSPNSHIPQIKLLKMCWIDPTTCIFMCTRRCMLLSLDCSLHSLPYWRESGKRTKAERISRIILLHWVLKDFIHKSSLS